jgi:serine/threonine-protein kinase RsbW
MKNFIDLPRARLQDLESIHQWLDELVAQTTLDETVVFALRLAIEEAFVNLVHHGYKASPGPVAIALQTFTDRVIVTIHDHAVPFSPEQAPHPQLDQDWLTRPVGGLGWHFIREMMDEIHYTSDQTGNVLTLIKRIK